MTEDELSQVVDSIRRRVVYEDIAFPELAIVRETIQALCSYHNFLSPWTREENCRFIQAAIRYWDKRQSFFENLV